MITAEPILDELLAYVGFGQRDAELLADLRKPLEPALDRVVDEFYARIEANPGAAAVFQNAEQMARQKARFRAWLMALFDGPYVDGYFEARARVGQAHVRAGLAQRYVVMSMNVVRTELTHAIWKLGWDAERSHAAIAAIDRICDVELALLLETYRADYDRALRTAERLAALGQFAGSVAHELRNPLAVLRTSSHILGRNVTDNPRAEKHLGRIDSQIAVCGQIVDDLCALARDQPPEKERVPFEEILGRAWELVPRTGSKADVRLKVEKSAGGEILHGDASQLRQVFVNVLHNAVQASPTNGVVRVSIAPVRFDAGATHEGRLCIRVEDEGEGFSGAALRHVFEPLFTTKTRGIGLGLSLCQRIVERHGGTIEVSNRDEGGACVEITLPIGPEQRSISRTGSRPETMKDGGDS